MRGADLLAEKPPKTIKKETDYDLCPISTIKRLIRTETVQRWEEDYQNGETASTTTPFTPNSCSRGIMKRVGLDGETAQVLMGHGGLAAYLHRFKRKDSPVCACGDEV
ncbi:unnamed protein product [Leptosia nina]|uniref:Uncharacterized protein n=1 Tax=Leptosia nina TaxID=320188 RepID=A0AAV1JYE3_9NEOP